MADEFSTQKGTCYLTPEFCSSRPRRHSQLESCNLVPPHPDYYSTVSLFFPFPLPHSLTEHEVTGVCAQAHSIFFKTKWPMVCFVQHQMGIRWGKILVLWKYPFLFSPLVAYSFSSYFHIPATHFVLIQKGQKSLHTLSNWKILTFFIYHLKPRTIL